MTPIPPAPALPWNDAGQRIGRGDHASRLRRHTARTVSWLTPKPAGSDRRLLVPAKARIADSCAGAGRDGIPAGRAPPARGLGGTSDRHSRPCRALSIDTAAGRGGSGRGSLQDRLPLTSR